MQNTETYLLRGEQKAPRSPPRTHAVLINIPRQSLYTMVIGAVGKPPDNFVSSCSMGSSSCQYFFNDIPYQNKAVKTPRLSVPSWYLSRSPIDEQGMMVGGWLFSFSSSLSLQLRHSRVLQALQQLALLFALPEPHQGWRLPQQ